VVDNGHPRVAVPEVRVTWLEAYLADVALFLEDLEHVKRWID
jgi:hypothetical protein